MVFFCFVGLPILALVDGGATECKVPLADISDELIIPDRCVFDAETPPPSAFFASRFLARPRKRNHLAAGLKSNAAAMRVYTCHRRFQRREGSGGWGGMSNATKYTLP